MWLSLLARYWYVAAIAAVAAWGTLGWALKNGAENDLAQYRLEQAQLVAVKQAEIIELQVARDKANAAITQSFLKGRRETEKRYASQLSELAALRSLWAARGVREADGSGNPMPTDAAPASGASGSACTDQPGELVAASAQVIADLETCEVELGKLTALQAWARGL